MPITKSRVSSIWLNCYASQQILTQVLKIVIVRHGKPDVPEFGKISADEFGLWITAYNQARLDSKFSPPKKVIEIANQCNVVICSDLPRSIESAHLLGVKDIDYIQALFREVELPYIRLLSPPLSPAVWAVFFRVLWFMGYAGTCEPLSTARQRASIAANSLHDKAKSAKSVLFVGHSILNSFIAKELLAKGWQGSASMLSKHWEVSVFVHKSL